MIAHEMVDRAVSVRQVAAQLGVDESTLRYRLGRSVDAPDGRAVRATALAGWDGRVDACCTTSWRASSSSQAATKRCAAI
jgi:hypothetical protein